MKIILDANELRERLHAHAYLAEKLGFPQYYGKNLDSLRDCLSEMDRTEIRIIHDDPGEDYYKQIKRVMLDCAQENPALLLEFRKEF